MKAIPVFRTFPALLAAGALLLGCEAQHPIAAPDDLQPQFSPGPRGAKGPIVQLSMAGDRVDEDVWADGTGQLRGDNPQEVLVHADGYDIFVNLNETHANALDELAASDDETGDANECKFSIPEGYAEEQVRPAKEELVARLAPGQLLDRSIEVVFDKAAAIAGVANSQHRIDGAGVGIGNVNGSDGFYGYIIVDLLSDPADIDDATTVRVFRVRPGEGTVGALTRMGTRPKDPIVKLRCRLQDDGFTVTIGAAQ